MNRFFLLSRCLPMLWAAMALSGCVEPVGEVNQVIRPVKTIVVDDSLGGRLGTFSGVSKSARESRLSFKVAGTIADIPVAVGDSVPAGTPIATLDATSYELQRQQADATLAQARAAERNARATYNRTQSLYAGNNASLGELDSARSGFESARAQTQAAEKALELANLNTSYTKLTLDVDCVVDRINVEINENVSTNTEVAKVNCSSDLEVEITVPETTVSKLSVGQTATVSFDALQGRTFAATVTEIGSGDINQGSTFPITIFINKSDVALRPGLAAAVSLDLGEFTQPESSTLSIPLAAVVRKTQGSFVFVVQPASNGETHARVAMRAIELGALTTSGVEVVAGLSKGDEIVTAGVSFLRDGLPVATQARSQ